MLNQIIRYYNQNRKKVWTIIIAIALGIALLQVLNYFAKANNNTNNQRGSSSANDTAIYQPDKSLVTGGNVSKKTYEKQSSLIDNFIKNCNEGKLEEAYSLLSIDCKTNLYPSLEFFINNYYKFVFTEKRDYSLENWTGNTYRVNMTHDLLASGKSNEGVVTQDYFTIVDENKESRLNINKYVGSEEINKEKQDEHLQVKVLKREKYIDYEIYDIYVKNISDKTIVLDDLTQEGGIYLTDQNDMKHNAYSNELTINDVTLDSQKSINFRLKFANPYISGRKIKSLTFSNAYLKYTEKGLYAYTNVRNDFVFTVNL